MGFEPHMTLKGGYKLLEGYANCSKGVKFGPKVLPRTALVLPMVHNLKRLPYVGKEVLKLKIMKGMNSFSRTLILLRLISTN